MAAVVFRIRDLPHSRARHTLPQLLASREATTPRPRAPMATLPSHFALPPTDFPTVRWGVLGAANIALKKVIPAMQASGTTPVVAIASRDLSKAREAAEELGIDLVASAPLLQGQLTHDLPSQVRELFGGTTDAQRALAFVRGLPGMLTAAVGMKTLSHVAENLAPFQQ